MYYFLIECNNFFPLNLTFIGLCIANIFARVQPTRRNLSRFIYFCKTLYMFQKVFPSIIRSSKLHIQRQVFVRPLKLPAAGLARLAAGSSNGLRLYVQFWAPDDGRKYRLKHVQRLTEINKSWKVASCWLYSANFLLLSKIANMFITNVYTVISVMSCCWRILIWTLANSTLFNTAVTMFQRLVIFPDSDETISITLGPSLQSLQYVV